MDVASAAARLNCDRTTLLELLGNGTIPAAKIGRAWVIRDQDVEAFLDEQVRKQTAERRTKAKQVDSDRQVDVTIVAQDVRQSNDGRRRRKPLPRLPQLPG